MRGVDGERREHGIDLAREVLLEERALVRRHVWVLMEMDVLLRERGTDVLVPAAVLPGDHRAHPLGDLLECGGGREAVRPGELGHMLALLLEAAHAHLEELVEIRTHDAEELQPLEQRIRRVARLVEHALVEFQPTQFAVHVTLCGIGESHRSVPIGAPAPVEPECLTKSPSARPWPMTMSSRIFDFLSGNVARIGAPICTPSLPRRPRPPC